MDAEGEGEENQESKKLQTVLDELLQRAGLPTPPDGGPAVNHRTVCAMRVLGPTRRPCDSRSCASAGQGRPATAEHFFSESDAVILKRRYA